MTLALLLLLTVAQAGSAVEQADRTAEEIAGIVAPRTVRIRGLRAGGRSLQPSAGVLVAGGRYVLTGTILASVGRSVSVLLPGEEEIAGTVRWFDGDLRLAVVELEDAAPAGGLTIAGEEVPVGEPVMAAGYPWGTPRGDAGAAVGLGIVARVMRSKADGPATAYVITAAVNPGDVGGPLIDRHGRLIALLAAAPDAASGLATAIPIRRVLASFEGSEVLKSSIPVARKDAFASRAGWPVQDQLREVVERSRRALLGVTVSTGRPAMPAAPRHGTAFLVGEGGFALVNRDLVEGARAIRAELHDGREVKAVALGEDVRKGLAVLRLEIDDAPAGLELAPEIPPVGTFVAAVGAPPAREPWQGPIMTIGIIGGTNRSDRRYGALHTDAPVNQANVGGPLLDLSGRAVGMISSLDGTLTTELGVNSGLGFAIPGPAILEHFDRMAKGELIPDRPGYLGVTLSQAMRETGGVEILEITPGRGAERAGLEPGDVIVSVDGEPISGIDDLRRIFVDLLEGQQIRLRVARGGKNLEIEARLGEWPAEIDR